MKELGLWGYISLVLVLIGGFNWGAIGISNINVVGAILGGGASFLSHLVYILIGVATIYLIYVLWIRKKSAL